MQDLIKKIYEEIERAGAALPSCADAARFALRAITASAGRAVLPGQRLSASARYSIACSAMSFAGTALASREQDSLTHAVKVALAATALKAANDHPDHEVGDETEAPEGWRGPRGGPFKTVKGETELVLTRRPHLPGGDWTLHFEGLPLAFAETASEAAVRGLALATSLSAHARRLPPAPALLTRTRKK